jgi:hypothetical protein
MTTPTPTDVFPNPTGDEIARFRAAAATGDTMIILPGNDLSITQAAESIFSLIAREHRLFYRGGRVQEVVADADGTMRFSPLTPAQFRSRLEQYGSVHAWRVGEDGRSVLKPTLCPEVTAKALLESQPAQQCLPNVELISKCPILANVNGMPTVLGLGWHPLDGGVYVAGGTTPPTVPIAEAVNALENLLSEFDFATPGDRSRALASLICPAMYFGSWLRGPAPVDFGEADASQSGKTYRQKLVAAIYGEKPNMVVQRNGGVGGLDENLSQKLIDGRPFILLDNLRGPLDSPYLEAILTAPGSIPARVPHRGEIQVDPRRFIFQMTSNGVETTRDLANRASIVRIRKRPSEFLFRAYPEGDLWDHVMANQPYYLGCVFSVITEWVNAGCPKTTETRHHFRPWAQTLDWIVQNIFHAAPLLDGQEEARARVSNSGLTWLRTLFITLRDAGRLSDHNAIQLAGFCIENDILPPGAKSGSDDMTVARSIGKVMAGIFRDREEVEIDGFKVHRIYRFSGTAGRNVPWYHFGNEPPSEPTPQHPPVQSELHVSDSDRPY